MNHLRLRAETHFGMQARMMKIVLIPSPSMGRERVGVDIV